MMSRPTCELGLDSQALSAWRSHLLDPAEEQRIVQHVPTCQSCQRTLSAYEQVAAAIRAQRVPSPRPALWREVQARVSRSQQGPYPMTRTQRRTAVAAVAAAAAVAALFALLLGAFHPLGPGIPPRATATATPPTATASATVGAWTAAGPAYGETVAVAPNAPDTMYACGLDSNTGDSQPVRVGVSHDAGKTWQSLPASPGSGMLCSNVRVSPTDPRYVALTITSCAVAGCGSGGAPTDLRRYVSADGGANWTRLALPADAVEQFQKISQYVWAGTTLFVSVDWTVGRPAGGHILAAGANGGPLAWVDQNGLLAGLPNDLPIDYFMLAARDTTLYLTLGTTLGTGCADRPQCQALWKTSDGGRTWAHAASTYGGLGVTIVTTPPSGAPLLALAYRSTGEPGPLLRSTDGGATWTALPPFPTGAHVNLWLAFEAPDGSIFMQLQTGATDQTQTIYELRPGASAWTRIVPVDTTKFTLSALAWDASGHPTTLWASGLGKGIWHYAL